MLFPELIALLDTLRTHLHDRGVDTAGTHVILRGRDLDDEDRAPVTMWGIEYDRERNIVVLTETRVARFVDLTRRRERKSENVGAQ